MPLAGRSGMSLCNRVSRTLSPRERASLVGGACFVRCRPENIL